MYSHALINVLQVVETSWIDFQQSLEQAADLDGIRQAHDQYILTIGTECKLHGKATMLMQKIVMVLDVAVEIRKRELEFSAKPGLRV